ncbi:diguanylate cyclase (GGDEF)-like protein [Desulfosalsimonas propionicica]|uniref:diguanylate cyclase n=1 Tax=Desulfosalsimonas propionicica TaxID=332175 RepID=A0A7W0HM08_9BACT|nr:GGDEF domain-containing protein [Desulfosalsimonas propionicica]MBA2882546.1 diguanylate cyclase (GGDEF)-like protein [Desulfosalsimonas propionicica]
MPHLSIKTRLNSFLGLILLAGFLSVCLSGYYTSKACLENSAARGSSARISLDSRQEAPAGQNTDTTVRTLRYRLYRNLLISLMVTALVLVINALVINRFQGQLDKLATADDLTGISNRRAFLRQAHRDVAQAGRYGTPVSLLIIDVDHFKNVNDALGHETGDLVLKAVADQIRNTIRENDLAGRMGGEEFAVILPRTDLEAACAAAERLRRAVADIRMQNFGMKPDLTVSIGVAARQDAYTDLNELMRMGDLALDEAKKRGKNRVCTMYDRTESK